MQTTQAKDQRQAFGGLLPVALVQDEQEPEPAPAGRLPVRCRYQVSATNSATMTRACGFAGPVRMPSIRRSAGVEMPSKKRRRLASASRRRSLPPSDRDLARSSASPCRPPLHLRRRMEKAPAHPVPPGLERDYCSAASTAATASPPSLVVTPSSQGFQASGLAASQALAASAGRCRRSGWRP
jgi:hypothetical protein